MVVSFVGFKFWGVVFELIWGSSGAPIVQELQNVNRASKRKISSLGEIHIEGEERKTKECLSTSRRCVTHTIGQP